MEVDSAMSETLNVWKKKLDFLLVEEPSLRIRQ
jgi:hypothetical protein